MAKRKKSEDESPEQNDADNFGLPDIDYKPLDSTESPAPEEEGAPVEKVIVEETTTYTYQPETQREEQPVSSYSSPSYSSTEEKSKAPLVIGLIIALVVVVAGALVYLYVYKPAAEKAKQEELARENERKRKENEARLAREREEEERKRREAEAAAANAKPAIGTIETLSERTRRYYVVVSSAVDGDLIMDYAKKLSTKGTSSKIIPPFGKWKFYRLAIGDYDTFANAQTNADGAKGEYGAGVWVIKY
jgi:uncharacterized membrane protein